MRCHRARRMLARKASQDLEVHEARMLRGHLDDCTECSALEDQLDRAWSALEHHPSIDVTPDFLPRLKAGMRTECPESSAGWTWRPIWRWQWVAVAVCIMLAAVFLNRTEQSKNSEPEAGAVGNLAAERDRRDELFLRDLEQTLQTSAVDFLSAYDSWPGGMPEQFGGEPSKIRPAGKMMKKEPS